MRKARVKLTYENALLDSTIRQEYLDNLKWPEMMPFADCVLYKDSNPQWVASIKGPTFMEKIFLHKSQIRLFQGSFDREYFPKEKDFLHNLYEKNGHMAKDFYDNAGNNYRLGFNVIDEESSTIVHLVMSIENKYLRG